jgi:hypothetical protein
MKSLKNKILLAALVAAFSGSALADCENFGRTVLVTHERSASEVRSVFDTPTHDLMKTKLGYTSAEVATMDLNAKAFFMTKLGLDFDGPTLTIPLGGGLVGKAIPLPGLPPSADPNAPPPPPSLLAVMVPFFSGLRSTGVPDYPVIYDSYSGVNKSFKLEGGNLVLFFGATNGIGVIPGGSMKDLRVQYYDNFFYGNIDLVKNYSGNVLSRYESFPTTSDQIGKTPLDSLGGQQFIVTLNMEDDGKAGYGISTSIVDKFAPDGVTPNNILRQRVLYTWACQ